MKKTLYSMLFVLSASFLCAQEPVESFDAFGQSLRRLMENERFYGDVKKNFTEYVRGRNFSVDDKQQIRDLVKKIHSHDDLLRQMVELGMEGALFMGQGIASMQNVEKERQEKMKAMPELSRVVQLADQDQVQQMINQGTTSVTINVDKTSQEVQELQKWFREMHRKAFDETKEDALGKKFDLFREQNKREDAEEMLTSAEQLFNKAFGQVRIKGQNYPTILPAAISGIGNALVGKTPSYIGLAMLRNFDYSRDLEQRILRLTSKYKDTLALTKAGRKQVSAFLYLMSSIYTPWRELQSARSKFAFKRMKRAENMPGFKELRGIKYLLGGSSTPELQDVLTVNLNDLLAIYKQHGETSGIEKRRMKQGQALVDFAGSLSQVFGSADKLANNLIKLYNAVLDGVMQGIGQ